jgi:hypothetical protein
MVHIVHHLFPFGLSVVGAVNTRTVHPGFQETSHEAFIFSCRQWQCHHYACAPFLRPVSKKLSGIPVENLPALLDSDDALSMLSGGLSKQAVDEIPHCQQT